jgi:Skp family chaperone for outer membrane proteins
MELAHQMRARRLVLRAHWLPRLENEEADALTNFDYRHFDPAKRVDVKLEDLRFAVLDDLFQAGEDYVAALEKAKEQQKQRRLQEKASTNTPKKQRKGKGSVQLVQGLRR